MHAYVHANPIADKGERVLVDYTSSSDDDVPDLTKDRKDQPNSLASIHRYHSQPHRHGSHHSSTPNLTLTSEWEKHEDIGIEWKWCKARAWLYEECLAYHAKVVTADAHESKAEPNAWEDAANMSTLKLQVADTMK